MQALPRVLPAGIIFVIPVKVVLPAPRIVAHAPVWEIILVLAVVEGEAAEVVEVAEVEAAVGVGIHRRMCSLGIVLPALHVVVEPMKDYARVGRRPALMVNGVPAQTV